MQHKIGTAAAAAVVAVTGLAVPAAQAAPAHGATVVHTAHRHGSFTFTAAGKAARASAVHGRSTTTTLGAVTFANNIVTSAGTTVVEVTLSQGGTQLAGGLLIGEYGMSAPQILPVGTYTVTYKDATSGSTLATGSITVTAGADSSDVLYPVTGGGDTAKQFTDNVAATPSGQVTLSVRHTSSTAGPVDVYVNGSKKLGPVLEGASADLSVPAGTYTIAITKTGVAPSPATDLADLSPSLIQDNYYAVYAVDDPSKPAGTSIGIDVGTFTLGYQFTARDGGVFNYGGFPFLGSTGGIRLNQPVVGGAEAASGLGYYLAASDGGVFAFPTDGSGPAFQGSLGGRHLNAPIVGIATTFGNDGNDGYLLVGADGGVFAFNAPFYGSLGGTKLSSPVVGIAADPSTASYSIAQADGTVTTFGPSASGGAATPQVSPAFPHLNAPIVGITATPDGSGAWLVAADGGVFAGSPTAGFYGSTGGMHLNQPIVGITSTFDGLGYALVASDGGVFNYGDSTFFGSTGSIRLNQPVVAALSY